MKALESGEELVIAKVDSGLPNENHLRLSANFRLALVFQQCLGSHAL